MSPPEGQGGLEAEACLVRSPKEPRNGADRAGRGRTAVMVGSSHHADATLPPEACQGLQAILLNFLEALQSERGHSASDLAHGRSGCLGLLDSSVEEGMVRRTRLPGRVLELSQTCWRWVCRWPEAAVPGSPSCALGNRRMFKMHQESHPIELQRAFR